MTGQSKYVPGYPGCYCSGTVLDRSDEHVGKLEKQAGFIARTATTVRASRPAKRETFRREFGRQKRRSVGGRP